MNYYENNMELLRRFHTQLYHKCNTFALEHRETAPVQIDETNTKESERSMTLTIGGTSYRLNSAVRPVSEAERWAAQFQFGVGLQVVSMFGLGNGLFLHKLREKLGNHTVLLIYEPSAALFFYAMNHYNLAALLQDPRIHVIVDELDPIAFREKLIQYVDFFNMQQQVVSVHPQYEKCFPEAYQRFFQRLQENDERIMVNKNTLARFSHLIVKNTLENLWILPKLTMIEDLRKAIPKNVPVIIVSAGPSLDKNMELLRSAKGHSLIICVDTAIKYMLQQDILPDLTITIEPEKPIEHYQEERCSSIPLVCDIEANPEIVRLHSGRKVLYDCRGYLKNLLALVNKDRADIGSGGSVATAAFALCYQLEFETILLIGQDLAYTGESTHAGGIASEGINKEIGQEWVESVEGGQVRTRGDWIAYLRWFENAIQVIKDTGKKMRVIDATEGGAKIKGTELMTLKEAVAVFCKEKFDFSMAFEQVKPSLTANEFQQIHQGIRKSRQELQKIRKAIEQGIKSCREAVKELDRMIKLNRRIEEAKLPLTAKASSQVKELNRMSEAALVYPLLNNYAVAGIADELQRLSADTGDSLKNRVNYFKKTCLAYEAMAEACVGIEAMLEQY